MSSEADVKENIAIEELKLLQSVVARHEHHAFRVKGWLFALMAAVTAAIFSGHLPATRKLELTVFIIVLGFGAWLTYHRLIIFYAIERVQNVEHHLRTGTASYDGPRISDSLVHPATHRRLMSYAQQVRDPQVWVPIGLAVLSLVAGFAAAPAIKADLPIGPAEEAHARPADSASMAIATPLIQNDPAQNVANGTILFGGLALIVGAALVFFGRDRLVKTAGIASLLAGAGLQFTLVKDLKIDKPFSIEKLAPTIDLAIDKRLQGLSLAPQHLGKIKNFELGEATIDVKGFADRLSVAEQELKFICDKWRDRVAAGRGLLLIVGSTDRVQLAGQARQRFEANAGLARARAENVKEYLRLNCWNTTVANFDDRSDVLVLVSGPQSTPPVHGKLDASAKPEDFSEDRSVDVYLLSSGAAMTARPDKRDLDVAAKER